MDTEMVRLEAWVRGRVQAVGFRAFVYDEAQRLGLGGWVRNAEDRSVYVVAEGPRPACETLLALLRRGPGAARVDGVETQWGRLDGAPAGRFEVCP